MATIAVSSSTSTATRSARGRSVANTRANSASRSRSASGRAAIQSDPPAARSAGHSPLSRPAPVSSTSASLPTPQNGDESTASSASSSRGLASARR